MPALLPFASKTKATQADLLTRDAYGNLWLWEIKTGMPVGFHRKQDTFSCEPLRDVPCIKQNIWQLQLLYTRFGLEYAGVPIYQSRVIQIYEHRTKGLQIVVYEPPEWTARIKSPFPPRCRYK